MSGPAFDIAADLDTPVSAFLKLAPLDPRFLLESVEGGERLARFSFLGLGAARRFILDNAGMELNGARQPMPPTRAALLDAFRQALAGAPLLEPAAALPFAGGLVGAASFDLIRCFEPKLGASRHARAAPWAHYIAPEALLVFDHVTRRIALVCAGGEGAHRRLRQEVLKCLSGPLPPRAARGRASTPRSSFTPEAFQQGVRRAQDHIAAGDVYQLVLANQFSGEATLDPFEVYRALRLSNPSAYMFYCALGERTLVGASPEALVRLRGGVGEVRPIAGTRRRGADAEEDARLADELSADPKELAEHIMLVDLARNDLGRVARAGGVVVEPLKVIERYSHVMHLVSGVRAPIRADVDGFDLFAAAFPAGTLSGAPKLRAVELIDALEPVNRGFYGGALGYFGRDEAGACVSMDHAITIRSIVFEAERYVFQAGAGVVADSDPLTENEEVMIKSATVRAALAQAEGA